MKLILKVFLIHSILLISLFSTSCVGEHEEYANESGLILAASKNSFSVENSEIITFTVTYNGEDVTDKAMIMNTTFETAEVLKKPEFTTYRPGSYFFKAVYNYVSSNEVEVKAKNNSGETADFYRRVSIMQHTGTWCTYCPNMGVAIKNAMKSIPDRIVVIAQHNGDEYTTGYESTLEKFFKVTGFPTAVVDFRPASVITSSSALLIKNAVNQSLTSYPAVCGIGITSKVENNKVLIDAKFYFTATNNYKVCVALVEDNIRGKQSGVSGVYEHNNTLRAYATDIMGTSVGNRVAGEEFKASYSIDFDANRWVQENCRVVVYVLNEQPGGAYFINNITTCPVVGSLDYEYEEAN